ncbi:flagellar protein FlgN [Tepidibacillus marianensis]|uniref:flagellar protein FlgN n=1 Tax=Tepidibacillus marianensis TaxID=3131995 RepID=UPI0030D3A5FA
MSTFQLLMNVLQDLDQIHIEMVELARYKKQVLIEGNVEELSRVMNLESQWVKQVGKLEEERVFVTQQLLQEKGLTIEEVTLLELAKILTSPKEKETINEMHTRLVKTVEEIKKLNDVNTLLIQQSLDYISNSIELVMGEPKPSFTYGNPASSKQKSSESRPGLFDQKA